MTQNLLKNIYFFLCVILVLVLGGIRSAPLYGKQDFILLDGRPWWNSWQPMIETIMEMGEQPILTDSITSTVLRGVFNQPAVAFRFNYHFSTLEIEDLIKMNQPYRKHLPVGGLLLLLDDQLYEEKGIEVTSADSFMMPSIQQLLIEAVEFEAAIDDKEMEKPYRCIINLHGFTASWVPSETKHWSRWLSYTSSLYTLQGVRLSTIKEGLNGQPFDNCMIFY